MTASPKFGFIAAGAAFLAAVFLMVLDWHFAKPCNPADNVTVGSTFMVRGCPTRIVEPRINAPLDKPIAASFPGERRTEGPLGLARAAADLAPE